MANTVIFTANSCLWLLFIAKLPKTVFLLAAVATSGGEQAGGKSFKQFIIIFDQETASKAIHRDWIQDQLQAIAIK